MKKVISIFILLISVCSVAFAGEFTPSIVRKYENNDKKYLTKTYEIATKNQIEFENGIEMKFNDGLKIYELNNSSKNGGTSKSTKEEVQIKIAETNSDKIEDILREFPAEISYEDENGFKGTLIIDTSSVTTTEISSGTYNKAYTVTETVEYQNYSANDLDKVPKTKVKNGVKMNLVSVDWKVQSTESIGNSQVPVSYKCIAYYSGNYTKQLQGEAKYTSSATYRGVIEKEETEPFTYELTYIQTFDGTWIVVVGALGFVILFIGEILYLKEKNKHRRRRKVKKEEV